MATRSDLDQTWRKRDDGTMELVSEEAVEREVPTDPDNELQAAIEAASTLDELKAALLGEVRSGRAAARPV